MKTETAGGWALVIGSLGYIGLMAAHPTHAGGDPAIGPFTMSGIVHGVALTLKPVLLFGAIVLTRWQGGDRAGPLLALCFYGLGAVFTMLAGAMSGLVFPYLIEAAHAPGGDLATIQGFARYTTWLNRSFAQVHVDMAALAILLWSLAWRGEKLFGWVVRSTGLVVALGVLGWQFSGHFNLEARHGALAVTLGEGVWTLLAAAALLARREAK